MAHDEIDALRTRLQETLSKRDAEGKYQSNVERELQELAVQVGASTTACYIHPVKGREVTVAASVPELAHNIHIALQTASMIDACRTATENVELAKNAQASASRAQQVAFWSMLAAWGAVVVNIIVAYIMAAGS